MYVWSWLTVVNVIYSDDYNLPRAQGRLVTVECDCACVTA